MTKEINTSEYVRMILRHRGWFLLGAALFATVALVASHSIQPKYSGTATFERRVDAATEGVDRSNAESFRALRITLQHELAGPEALEAAADELGLTKNLPVRPDGTLTDEGTLAKQNIVRGLATSIDVKWKIISDQVDMITVTAMHPDPKLAQALPNILVRNYIDSVSKKVVERLLASQEFLTRQVAECDAKLSELNRQKTEFETRNGGVVLDNAATVQERIQDAKTELGTVRLQKNRAVRHLAELKAMIKKSALDRQYEELQNLQRQLQKMVNIDRMTENHPTVEAVRQSIAAMQEETELLRNKLGEIEDVTGLATTAQIMQLSAAQSDVETCTAEVERLERKQKAYEQLLTDAGPIRQQYQQLLQPVEELTKQENRWKARLVEVQLALAGEQAKKRTHLSTVQEAQFPLRPFFPTWWKIVGFALGGGVAFGFALAILAGLFDRVVRTGREAAEYFGLPVLGAIEEILTPRQRLGRQIRRVVMSLVICLAALGSTGAAGLSVFMKYQQPERYSQWQARLTGGTDNVRGPAQPASAGRSLPEGRSSGPGRASLMTAVPPAD